MTNNFYFSDISLKRLSTCKKELQEIMNEAIKQTEIDFTIVCGYRGKAEQDEAYFNGFSMVKWPNSRHNKYPSGAVDICPYYNGCLQWEDVTAFEYLAELIKTVSADIGYDIEWGGDWENFVDMPHFQLSEV